MFFPSNYPIVFHPLLTCPHNDNAAVKAYYLDTDRYNGPKCIALKWRDICFDSQQVCSVWIGMAMMQHGAKAHVPYRQIRKYCGKWVAGMLSILTQSCKKKKTKKHWKPIFSSQLDHWKLFMLQGSICPSTHTSILTDSEYCGAPPVH